MKKPHVQTLTPWPITKLRSAEYNPRRISQSDFDQLKASIDQFGYVEPIIVNTHESRNGVVVGGHQRLRALKQMGHKQVACVEVCLTLEEEKELNLRLNRNHGEFDFDILANEFDHDDLLRVGFTGVELGLDDAPSDNGAAKDTRPKECTCPNCGEVFNPKEHMKND